MTDLNEWNIQYTRQPTNYAVDYDFGSLALDTPFTVQMEIGDADAVTNDLAHGTEDASLFGVDQALATDLIFNLTTVPDPNNPDRMTDAMDKVSEFAAVWRGQGMRNIPGQYATITNQLRGRSTFGRPRNFSRKHGSGLRRGVIEFLAQFRTMTPYWYALPMHSITLPIGGPYAYEILGDEITWPIITFNGPFATCTLNWNPGIFLNQWNMVINHAVADGDQLRVDTRPWVRSAELIDGTPVNGWLAGDAMRKCFINPTADIAPLPPGQFTVSATGSTDAGTLVGVEWADTFAGL